MRLIPCLLLSCLLSTHALAVDGWENLRWGASKKQVMEAYPAAEDLAYPRRPYRVIQLKGYQMAGYDFTVHFLMDQEERLQGVALAQESEPAPVDRRLEDAERVLTARYGKPVEVMTGGPRKLEWIGENGSITTHGPSVGIRIFRIIFTPKSKAEKEPVAE